MVIKVETKEESMEEFMEEIKKEREKKERKWKAKKTPHRLTTKQKAKHHYHWLWWA